jgi:hypothetical protein
MLGTMTVFLVATALSADLSTAAKLGNRSSLCAPRRGQAGSGLSPSAQSGSGPSASALSGEPAAPDAWDQVRERGRLQLCRRLARAQLALGTRPELALQLARELAQELPERAEPRVIEAQAQTRRRAFADAWPAWQAARPRGDEPLAAHALRDYAICAAMTGHAEAALASYRRLLPLLEAWPDPVDQQAIYLEAAVAALQRGPEGLEEATGQLAVARARATSTGLRAVAAGLSALLAARRGDAASGEGRLDAPEVWHFVENVQRDRWPARWPVVPPHELFGAAALLIEPYSDTRAAELWQRHAAGLEQAAAPERWRALAAERLRRAQPAPRSAP